MTVALINVTVSLDGSLTSDQTDVVTLLDVVQTSGSKNGLSAVIGERAHLSEVNFA